jgi:hypothetical protein
MKIKWISLSKDWTGTDTFVLSVWVLFRDICWNTVIHWYKIPNTALVLWHHDPILKFERGESMMAVYASYMETIYAYASSKFCYNLKHKAWDCCITFPDMLILAIHGLKNFLSHMSIITEVHHCRATMLFWCLTIRQKQIQQLSPCCLRKPIHGLVKT